MARGSSQEGAFIQTPRASSPRAPRGSPRPASRMGRRHSGVGVLRRVLPPARPEPGDRRARPAGAQAAELPTAPARSVRSTSFLETE